MTIRYIYLVFILCFFVLPITAKAEPLSDLGCDKAQSTSAIQQCLKGKLDSEQKRLTKAYAALDKQFEAQEKRDELKELQKTWLNYRDQECMWEAAQATAPGLKGIVELSCMVRLSADRADLLEITYMDIDPDTTRQFGNVTRWKNLLANEYSDIIWDYKNINEVDLTCNDKSEIIVRGVKYNSTDMYEMAAQPLFEKQEVIAVIDNPAIGAPTATIFAFDIWDEVGEAAPQNMLCSGKIKLETNVVKTVDEETEELKTCESSITIDNGKCNARQIIWDGKVFSLADRAVASDEKTEE